MVKVVHQVLLEQKNTVSEVYEKMEALLSRTIGRPPKGVPGWVLQVDLPSFRLATYLWLALCCSFRWVDQPPARSREQKRKVASGALPIKR